MPNLKKVRIQHKGETESNWQQSSLIPLENELIIYEPDETYDYPRIKIGDGVTGVNDLPFITASLEEKIEEIENAPIMPAKGATVTTVVADNENCTLIEHFNSSEIIKLTKSLSEKIIFVTLNNQGISLEGQKVLFGSIGAGRADEITYNLNGIDKSLSEIKDGRGWNEGQTLQLLVKGSGIEGEFEYVRLLNIPYPSAEEVSF